MNWHNTLVLAVVLGLVALLGFGLTRNPDDLPSPLVGEPAPAFSLPTLDGEETVSLADLSDRPVVVNFWASWCLACIQEHPALVRAWRRYRDRGVEMVGILYQDTPENARRYIRKRGGSWTQLLDPGTRTAIDFGVYGVPETFFIDAQGRVAHKHVGPVYDELLTNQIETLLQGVDSADATSTSLSPAEGSLP